MQPVKLHSSTYQPAGVSVQLFAVFRQEPMFLMTSREANMTSLSMLQSHTSTSWQETITSLRQWMMRLLRRLKTELRRSDSATSSCSGSASQLPSSKFVKDGPPVKLPEARSTQLTPKFFPLCLSSSCPSSSCLTESSLTLQGVSLRAT